MRGVIHVDTVREPAHHALLVYESMFGCTAEVASAVADGLAATGFTVEVHEVRHAPTAAQAEFDLLVVGAPTHAFSLSRASTRADAVRQGAPDEVAATGVREWLGTLGGREESRHRPAAAFDTRVTRVRNLPKAASTRAAHLLRRHGYRLVSRPAPFLVEDLKGPLAAGELDRAHAWGRAVGRAAAGLDTPGTAAS